jgi:hypothetical protein
MDYMAPQLYWSLASTGQNFSLLLDWWLSVNIQRRHVWPGLAAYRVADGTSSEYLATEITAQIAYAKSRVGVTSGGASGALLYNTTSVRLNRGGLADALGATSYSAPALVPRFPWLDDLAPPAPSLTVSMPGSTVVRVQWSRNGDDPVRWWLLQWRTSTEWRARLVWGASNSFDIPSTGVANQANIVVLSAMDAAMNASAPAIWRAAP